MQTKEALVQFPSQLIRVVLIAQTPIKCKAAQKTLKLDGDQLPKFEFKYAFPGEIFSADQYDCAVAVASTSREVRFMTE